MSGVRILAAGLVLLGAGCAVLGWGARLGKTVRNDATGTLTVGLESNAVSAPEVASAAHRELQARAHSILTGLPLIFEPNLGQGNLDPADARARFVTHGSGYSMVLGSDGVILSLVSRTRSANSSSAESRVQTLQMKLAGANPNPGLTAVDPLPGKSNYFIGNNPAKWRTGVPQFARVRYENVYPGINLVFYGNDGHLEYDFQVAPGVNPSQAELEFSGAKKLELKGDSLLIRGENGIVRLDAPKVYQEVDGRRQPVEGAFVLRAENRVGFAVGAYDHSRELVIDPILNFSTYFGGSGDEHDTSLAVDGSLNIYLAGSTTSPNLPVPTGAKQTTLNGAQNVYIAKIQPPLGQTPALLLNLTYLGGSGSDYPVGIKVDGEGNPYVAGTTTSGDFPITATNAYQASAASVGKHVFVTKMKFDFTSLDYSSYLSGNGTDIASGMTIDPTGNLYVIGTTTSVETSSSDQFPASNLPEALPYQNVSRAAAGIAQFFVTKVNTNAPRIASIPYSTYFGGGTFNTDANTPAPVITGGGIAVDTNLNIYFTGTTNFLYSGCTGCSTTDFPILNAYQPCLDSPPATNIVNPQSCANTGSPASPDAFVAKLNPSAAQGQQLIWSTYLGGSHQDSSVGVALDSGATNVYVVGTTNSGDFVSSSAVVSYAPYQKCLDNVAANCNSTAGGLANDAFVARLTNPTSTGTNVALNYFSYLGGAADEEGLAITVDSNSGAMIAGSTQSPFVAPAGTDGNFPVFPYPSSIQSQLGGTQDAFIARLNTGATTGQSNTASWASYFGGTGIDSGTGITLDVNQDTYLAGETNSTDLQTPKALQTTNGGGYDSFVTHFGTAVSLSISGVLSVSSGQQYISAGTPATFTYTVTNNGPDLASNIVISANLQQSVTQVPLTNVSASISSGTCGGGGSSNTGISCGPISLASGSTATVTITATPTASSSGASPISFNGGTVQAMSQGNIVLAQTSVPAQMTDFSMKVSPSNQNVNRAGDTAVYTVNLTPYPLYTSSISISCSNLPAATTCRPSSSSVSLSSTSGASVALNVVTTARPVTTAAGSMFDRRFYAVWLAVPGLLLFGGGRRRRMLGIMMLCTVFAMLLFVPACSSGKTQTPVSGTPAGSYSINVTAAAGSDSKTQNITLNVP